IQPGAVEPIFLTAASGYKLNITSVQLSENAIFVPAGASTVYSQGAAAPLPTPTVSHTTLGVITEVGGAHSITVQYNPNDTTVDRTQNYVYNGNGELIFAGANSTYSGGTLIIGHMANFNPLSPGAFAETPYFAPIATLAAVGGMGTGQVTVDGGILNL